MNKELENIFKKHNTDLATYYWTIAVEDYLSAGDGEIKPTKKRIKEIVDRLLNDDNMWEYIYNTMEEYL